MTRERPSAVVSEFVANQTAAQPKGPVTLATLERFHSSQQLLVDNLFLDSKTGCNRPTALTNLHSITITSE